eukprot:5176692-Lingulodinium_polyedra.AAC.1
MPNGPAPAFPRASSMPLDGTLLVASGAKTSTPPPTPAAALSRPRSSPSTASAAGAAPCTQPSRTRDRQP